jgi:hypothetical protein
MGRVPLLPEAGFLRGPVQMEFLNNPSGFIQIQTPAVRRVAVKSQTQLNQHQFILWN